MTTLLEHFKDMQAMASAYLEPKEYEPRSSPNYDASNATKFINDIIYMLDGPEQREAQEDAEFNYTALAIRTESLRNELNPNFDSEGKFSRLLHAGLGMATEAGEFLDPLKKAMFYGRSFDTVNLKEEIGDVLWYLAIACDALGTTIEAEMRRNIAKLKARYADKFTEHDAINRNLEVERAVLETGRSPISGMKQPAPLDGKNFPKA